MGREVKRVPLDFNYPLNMVWKGYMNPYRGLECKPCGGSGMGPEYKKLSDDWYGFDRPHKRWCHDITQDEVQALVDGGRLWDFVRVPINDEQREVVKKKVASGENSWLPYDNGVIPTAFEINEWSKNGMGHDSLNHWVCTTARAKRLGIDDYDCPTCGGGGTLWADEKYERLHEDFERIQPPEGEGWQMWETTSEGSPMSPVFNTPEELASWLAESKASSFGSQGASYDSWLSMITRGWAPSAIMTKGELKSGVEACD